MPSSWTLVRTCGVLSLLCGTWNLFGDLYYLDYYTAHMSMDEGFGAVLETPQPGKIFNLDNTCDSFWMYVAQAGGWMYPVWAASTALPLYVGLKDAGYWYGAVPCLMMAYGMCVMGGALHSGFALLTAIPGIYHCEEPFDERQPLSILNLAQFQITKHIGVGCLAGYVSLNVSMVWIAYTVATRRTMFPKWFNAFSPFVTMVWVSALSYLLRDPWGFYLRGCMGTWGVSVLNMGATLLLWNDTTDLSSLLSDAHIKGD